MRKIYSLVLMAAALLVGTNAWADAHATLVDGIDEAKVTKDGGTTWMYATSLKDAFDYVGYGETAEIVLLRSINVEAPITMPGTIPTYPNGKGRLHEVDGQNITLNLNGKNITTTAYNVTPFRILKGSLDIEGSGIITKEHTNRFKDNGAEKVYGEPDWYGGAIVAISGAQDSLAADWSVLTIGKDVMLQFNRETGSDGKVLKSKAIAITNFAGLGWAKVASGETNSYNGTTYTQGEGTDFLARKYNALGTETSALNTNLAPDQIDKFGYATRITKNIWDGDANSHGEVSKIAEAIANNKSTFLMGWGALSGANKVGDVTYYKGIMQGCAFGVKVIVEGKVLGSYYGIHIHGNISQTPEGLGETKTRHIATAPYFTHQFPYLKVGKTATVASAADGSCNGIYVAGYGVVDIEGEVYGATGVYMKSGDVVCNDANIRSTFTGDAVFNWGTFGDGGTHGAGGSAIVAETSDAYAGGMGVTIQGDTKVTGSTGYAIFDQTTVTETIVDDVTTYSTTNHITIEGGTIESGTLGTIAVTQGAVDATSIAGGNVEGTTVTISNPNDPGQTVTIPTTDFIQPGTHTTTVTDGTKTIVVVSQGAAPTEYVHVYGNLKDSVKWVGTGADATETLEHDLTLKELEINQSYNQTLIIGDPENVDPDKRNITLTVGRVILGTQAQIIVNPGSKLIVKGDQGIVAPKTSNIILKTNETTPAEFLFKPSVSSNRHPNATVQLIANSYTSATNPSADYRYQRFGVPTHTALKGLTAKNPSTNTDVQMFVRKYENNGWLTIGYINVPGQSFNYSKMNDPFGYYILQCNVPEVGTLVSMSGELVGNVDASLTTGLNSNGWSTFTNSYSAKLNMLAMMDMFAGLNVASSAAIYFQTNLTGSDNTLTWGVFNLATIHFDDVPTELNPMQAFLIKDPNVTVQSMNLNYNTMVWNPATGSEAPQRAISNLTKMAVKVYDDANIQRDAVYMLQADQFSEDMDQGYDAVKYMNENINLYVMNDERLVTMATDNLAGHYLGFSCEKGGIYTLSFEQLAGDLFTLVDLENNATMDINEGFSYQFEVASNTTDDYRFLIVERQNAPTDLDSVNETVVKENGIYTVTGQYMGNMSVWNTLPAGLYIVNGEKKVK